MLLDLFWIGCIISIMALLIWVCRRADKPKMGEHNSQFDSPERPNPEEWIAGRWDFTKGDKRD